VLTYPLHKLQAPAHLTAAEREVALAFARGCPLREIARQRQTAFRTVANQVRATYAKLGVQSRFELALALLRVDALGQNGKVRV
jgi:DNA-binding NarL/FixJ family response regulator